MVELSSRLLAALAPAARDWLQQTRQRLAAAGPDLLPQVYAALARRTGRGPLGGGVQASGDRIVDFDAWRLCDAAGAVLVQEASASDELIAELYLHGDYEERAIVLRGLALLDVRPVTLRLLGEAQRTNVQAHFEACVCDSNLLARVVGHPDFPAVAAYRVLLKGAFLDVPLVRFFGILEHASPELTRMVTGLATEREAANRPVWTDTCRVIARAPIPGTLERIAAALEHGDVRQRLSAAEALGHLRDERLHALARARREREPVAAVQAALDEALARQGH